LCFVLGIRTRTSELCVLFKVFVQGFQNFCVFFRYSYKDFRTIVFCLRYFRTFVFCLRYLYKDFCALFKVFVQGFQNFCVLFKVFIQGLKNFCVLFKVFVQGLQNFCVLFKEVWDTYIAQMIFPPSIHKHILG
jgi:hypothetical protein